MSGQTTSVPIAPSHTPTRRRAWKVGACLLAIFIGGGVVGAILTLQLLRHELSRRADPVRWTALMLDKIDRQVHFTPDQRRELEPVVRGGIGETFQVRDHASEEIAGIVQRSRAQAAKTLSADQMQRLDAFIQQRTRLLQRWTGKASPAATPAASPLPPAP